MHIRNKNLIFLYDDVRSKMYYSLSLMMVNKTYLKELLYLITLTFPLINECIMIYLHVTISR